MSRKIVFEPIAFEDEKQKKSTQFTTTVALMKEGKKVYPDEVTGFMHQEYSGFAPAKFNPPENRDWIRIPINEEEKEGVEFMNAINEYDDSFENQKELVFGKFSKFYSIIRSVKEPKEEDELEMEANADKPKKPKYKSIKLKLKMAWNYYYDDQLLDSSNTSAVRKAVGDALSKNNDRKLIDDVIVTLRLVDEDGKKIDKKLKMSEIESRKEIASKVYYRKVDNPSTDLKKVSDCKDNQELEELYGKPEEMTVKSPEDLDKYHRANCYVRYLYGPSKIWAAKSKGDDGKRRSSLQFVCHQIDIIHMRTNMNGTSSVRSIYSGYGFGSRPETVFQSTEKTISKETISKESKPKVKKDEDEEEDDDEDKSSEASEDEPKSKSKSKSVVKSVDTKSSKTKQTLKVESEDEFEEESADEESVAEESGSDDSESDEEPEPPKKGAKGKAIVEETKSKKAPTKRK